ncbi:unnamed protein product [Medioppia subpectinata]|uniref:Uncharacterized protein n=1 Tax=Medioppia subpectinata TaxID=1979941 RepID=A0A7R9KIE9_9ACAR|nr:unnamed protein product [Medioppia subpectinata]CAG2104056.1 unnamed protein product [Medioppia subpectinata]
MGFTAVTYIIYQLREINRKVTFSAQHVGESRNFSEKVVLVTGSNSGIGAGIVKLFASLGAYVVVTGRNEARINRVFNECHRLSPEFFTLKTNTYYAIQNQRTSKFLIWFGKTGTIAEDLDVKKAKFWHIFHKLDNGWYKMMHHFNSHTVRIGKSHDEGFYHIYNKDCFNAEHPNADADINGTIMCFIPSVKTDYLEFNWRFLEKQGSKKSIPVNDKSVDSTSSRHPNPLFKALIPLFALVIIGIGIYVIKLRGNSFQGSPTTVLYNHSNPAYAPDMPVTHDPPPYIPQQSYNNARLY